MMRFLAHSGFFLALSGVAVCLTAVLLFNLPVEITFLIIPFLLVFSSYHINRKAEIEEDLLSHKERTVFLLYHGYIDYLAIFSFLIVIVLSFSKNIGSLFIVFLIPVIVLLYSCDVIPFFIRKALGIGKLKQLPLIKNLVVGCAWALLIFLVIMYYQKPFDVGVVVLAGFVYLRLVINTATFDIRDIDSDRLHKVNTIPVLFGKNTTINGLHIINLFSVAYIVFFSLTGLIPFFSISLAVFGIYGLFFLEASKDSEKIHFLCDYIIDGEYILWPIMLVIFKIAIGLF